MTVIICRCHGICNTVIYWTVLSRESQANGSVHMMTSPNVNIFRITGPLWGESPVILGIPSQRRATRSFDVFFGLRLNKRFSKQSRRRWFETPSRPFDVTVMLPSVDSQTWTITSMSHERHGIYNHQKLDCFFSTAYSRYVETAKLCITGLCEENALATDS